MSARPAFNPRRIISELEIDAFGMPTDLPPLSAAEHHRDRTVTRTCSHCGRRMLCRDLVDSRSGIRCLNKTKCNAANGGDFDEVAERAEREAYLSHAPSETLRSKMATWRAANGTHVAAAPTPTGNVISTCGCCGRTDTHESWATLKFLDAKDVTDEGVTTHEEMRNCVCGSTRMVVSDREGLVYYRGGGQ